MKRMLRNTVIVSWIMIGATGPACQTAAAAGPDAGNKISIYLRNYAHVDQKTLTRAGEIVAAIFANAGVETVVMDANELDDLSPLEPRDLFVHIFTREMARKTAEDYRLPANALGLAPGTAAERNRNNVYVFDHIADGLVQEQPFASKAEILGYAMAHEIGHLLLNMAQHSRAGIMQANWRRKDMEAMTMGWLTFDSIESARIRAEVTCRTNQQPVQLMAAVR